MWVTVAKNGDSQRRAQYTTAMIGAPPIYGHTMRKLALLLTVALLPHVAIAAQPIPQGAQFEAGFSPKRGSLEIILKGINSAKHSIRVAAYSLTSKPVSVALLEAQKRGVDVAVVADQKSNGKGYSAAQFLANQGVPVRLNGNYAILHHKFMVIDDRHVELGSFNYSAAAAERNAENVLLLWNVAPIAAEYSREWQRLWNEATPLEPAY